MSDPMAPWLNYPPSDPRSGRSNWRLDEATGQPIYIGPAVSDYNYDAAEPYGTSDRAIHSGGDSTTLRSQDAYSPPPMTYPAAEFVYDPSGGTMGSTYNTTTAAPRSKPIPATIVDPPPLGAGPPPQPAYDPLSSAYPTAAPEPLVFSPSNTGDPYGAPSGQAIGYGSGQSDFITPHIPLYDGMLAGGGSALGSAGSAPLTAPPVIVGTDPVTGVPIYEASATGGSDPYGYGYDAGYGGGSSFPGADFGYGTDPATGLPLFPNGEAFGSAERNGMTPYGFDPFLWAEVKNPMPPASPLRGQIMQAGGFAGPAWAPAPPPQPPGPMAYVRARLGMQEPGHTLEMKPPVPGFRFDGTPRSEPKEESANFVPADQAGMFPPLPPTFPRRGY